MIQTRLHPDRVVEVELLGPLGLMAHLVARLHLSGVLLREPPPFEQGPNPLLPFLYPACASMPRQRLCT